MMTRDVGLLNLPGAEELIGDVCAAEGVEPALLVRLLEIEQGFAGMTRRRGIFGAIDNAMSDNPDQPQ